MASTYPHEAAVGEAKARDSPVHQGMHVCVCLYVRVCECVEREERRDRGLLVAAGPGRVVVEVQKLLILRKAELPLRCQLLLQRTNLAEEEEEEEEEKEEEEE